SSRRQPRPRAPLFDIAPSLQALVAPRDVCSGDRHHVPRAITPLASRASARSPPSPRAMPYGIEDFMTSAIVAGSAPADRRANLRDTMNPTAMTPPRIAP